IGVERRFGERLVAEPESETDDLARVCLAGDPISLRRRNDMTLGVAGVGDVEGVPEVMHRTSLAGVSGREPLQRQVPRAEAPPVAVGPDRVVARVLGIVAER